MFREFINNIIKFQSKTLLSFISFIESIFFPIPADVLLIPMSLKFPHEWKYLSLITTISSVIGGLVGYALGAFLFDEIYPYIVDFGYEESLETEFYNNFVMIKDEEKDLFEHYEEDDLYGVDDWE